MLDGIIARARRAIQEELLELTQTQQEDVRLFILAHRTSLRPYLLNREYVRQVLWPQLREEDDHVFHFVFNSLTTFLHALELDSTEELVFNRLVQSLLFAHTNLASRDCVDLDFHNHLPVKKDLEELYHANPWLVWLLFIFKHYGELKLHQIGIPVR